MVPKEQYARVPIHQIVVGTNVRRELGDLTDLITSVREHGVLEPLVGCPSEDRQAIEITGSTTKSTTGRCAPHARTQTPTCSSSNKANPPTRRNKYAPDAKYARRVSTMRSVTTSDTAYGVAVARRNDGRCAVDGRLGDE